MRVIRASAATGAGFVLGYTGALSVAAVGLVVPAYAAWPLTLGLAALLPACGLVFLYLVSPFGASPVAGAISLPYLALAWTGFAVAVVGGLLAVLWAGSLGREIGKDAVLTLALVAAILPTFATALYTVCGLLGRCGA